MEIEKMSYRELPARGRDGWRVGSRRGVEGRDGRGIEGRRGMERCRRLEEGEVHYLDAPRMIPGSKRISLC